MQRGVCAYDSSWLVQGEGATAAKLSLGCWAAAGVLGPVRVGFLGRLGLGLEGQEIRCFSSNRVSSSCASAGMYACGVSQRCSEACLGREHLCLSTDPTPTESKVNRLPGMGCICDKVSGLQAARRLLCHKPSSASDSITHHRFFCIFLPPR